MKVNKQSHYFEELTDEEAYQLILLAEKLHMQATVSLDNPLLKAWLDVVNPNDNLLVNQQLCKSYLPFKMAMSASKYFMQRSLV